MIRSLKLLSLSLLLSISACADIEQKPFFGRMHGMQVADNHSPDYKKGWDDGCRTGSAVYGNHWSKEFYDFTRDVNQVGNPEYESAWYDAYHFCRQSHNTQINNWDSDWWGILSPFGSP